MNDLNRVGILRETKNPPDRRVPLTPAQCLTFQERFPKKELCIQPSFIRGFEDQEYRYLELDMKEDLSDCDVLLGIKEVDYTTFMPGKPICSLPMWAKNSLITAGCCRRS